MLLLTITLCLSTTPATAAMDAGKPTVLITGANRGIGLEFVRQLAERRWNIIATARSPQKADDLIALAADYPQIVIEQLDVTDHPGIDALAAKYRDHPIDILLSNAGLTPNYSSAFKRLKGIDFDIALKSYAVNAIGPLKLAQAFMPHIEASEQKKIIIISSRAGSFEQSPKLPMMYSYRGSKAALNMYMYTLAFETPKKGIILTLLSPGQVNTSDTQGMKRPGVIEPDESVTKMLLVIDGLTPDDNGKFLSHEGGELIGW
jgi:NAD(P)-dependent dehydrogenase (short-subunit alcohol dehydrogenase family)